MSLDVTLYSENTLKCKCGIEHKLTDECLYNSNITHNLRNMAKKAGIYEACWRPYMLHENYKDTNDSDLEYKFECSVKMYAKDIIPFLEKGYEMLKNDQEYFQQFDSKNGWGLYIHFLPFVKKYLDACRQHPESLIITSR